MQLQFSDAVYRRTLTKLNYIHFDCVLYGFVFISLIRWPLRSPSGTHLCPADVLLLIVWWVFEYEYVQNKPTQQTIITIYFKLRVRQMKFNANDRIDLSLRTRWME